MGLPLGGEPFHPYHPGTHTDRKFAPRDGIRILRRSSSTVLVAFAFQAWSGLLLIGLAIAWGMSLRNALRSFKTTVDPTAFFLNGQHQGARATGFGLVAASVSSVTLMGGTGLIYRDGIPAAVWLALVWIAASFALILVGDLAREAAGAGALTLAEAVSQRFAWPFLLRSLISLVGLLFAFVLVVIQLRACGSLADVWLPGLFETACVIAAGLCLTGTISAGGPARVTRTELLGMAIMLGLAAVALAALSAAGVAGTLASLRTVTPSGTEFHPLLPTTKGSFAGLAVVAFAAAVLQPAVWQCCASSRTNETLNVGAWIYVGLSLALAVSIALVGFAGRSIFPVRWGDAWQSLPNAAVSDSPEGFDQLFSALVRGEFPGLFVGLGMLAAGVALLLGIVACLAVLEANLLAIGTLAVRDFYLPVFRPAASPFEQIRAARGMMALVVVCGLVVVLFSHQQPEYSLWGMFSDVALVASPLLLQAVPAAVDMLFFQRGRGLALGLGMLAGVLLVLTETQLVELLSERIALVDSLVSRWARYRSLAPLGLPALAVNVFLATIFSLFGGEDAPASNRPAKS